MASLDTTYNTKDVFDHANPHVSMVNWAPQAAALLYPSVDLFVSRTGMGSLFEPNFAGKCMLLFPFFGGQLGNTIVALFKSVHIHEK